MNYLKHLKLLEHRKDERKKQRIAEACAKAKKKYKDYDWNAMLSDGSLAKQTMAVFTEPSINSAILVHQHSLTKGLYVLIYFHN